jgi:hypothetical protein
MGYWRISQYLNTLGLVTPYGNTFTNTHVFSILKKGGLRKERLSQVEVKYQMIFEEKLGKEKVSIG